jgi:hypothetical protein
MTTSLADYYSELSWTPFPRPTFDVRAPVSVEVPTVGSR